MSDIGAIFKVDNNSRWCSIHKNHYCLKVKEYDDMGGNIDVYYDLELHKTFKVGNNVPKMILVGVLDTVDIKLLTGERVRII